MESKAKNSSTISTEKLLMIEVDLLHDIDSAINEGTELSEKEKLIYNAFSAVQDLRKYLEGKSGPFMMPDTI